MEVIEKEQPLLAYLTEDKDLRTMHFCQSTVNKLSELEINNAAKINKNIILTKTKKTTCQSQINITKEYYSVNNNNYSFYGLYVSMVYTVVDYNKRKQ